MNTLEGRAWRILAGAEGAGSKALWRIADYLSYQQKTASWLIKNPEKLKDALGINKANLVIPDLRDQEYEEDEKLEEPQVALLHPLHPDFPPRIKNLKDIVSLPALLFVRGNIALLNRPGAAIVGKRQAGQAGLALADSLACELAGNGISITSGYAAGIDTAAHLAALRSGGTTTIVLSEGIARFQIKPEFKEYLTADNILVISQFEPEARWAAYMAMTRNKLVDALSGAVVVIVSGPERDANGKNSGTFNAGISALKMGVPVFVVSPDFFAAHPEGNRQLIAKGCREWNPAYGTAPIISAVNAQSNQKSPPGQRNLFENDA